MHARSKRILILGTGPPQADAIRCSKALGCEVHAVASKPEGPGLPLADRFEAINIVDRRSVLAYAKHWACDAVYSVGSDIAMPTVAYVADAMGLRCPLTLSTAERLQDKERLRGFLAKSSLSPLPFAAVACVEDLPDWPKFPAIVKPVDSQGGRGVAMARRRAELAALVRNALRFSRAGKAIIEEYVSGPEFSVNAFLQGGQMKAAVITDRLVHAAYPSGVVLGHVIPSAVPDAVRGNALELAARIAREAGLEDGPVYFQMKHVGERVFVIEVAPRLDGCHLWRLIKEMYGADLLEASLRFVLGRPGNMPFDLQPRYDKLRLDFFTQRPGAVFVRQPVDEAALYSELFYQPGEVVRAVNGYAEKTGYQIRRAGPRRDETRRGETRRGRECE